MLKTVQLNFVVNTPLIQYCVYYEIYLNSLYVLNSKFVEAATSNNFGADLFGENLYAAVDVFSLTYQSPVEVDPNLVFPL